MSPGVKRHTGFTLIELVVFITVVAIAAVALFKALARSLPIAPTPQDITQATQIAQERMELILGQKDRSDIGDNYLNMTDPCFGAGAPAICNTSALGLTVTVCGVNAGAGCAAPPIPCPAPIDNNTANCKSITVTVTDSTTGNKLAVLTSLLTHYPG